MLQKFLVVCVLAFSFSPAFAKGNLKKHAAVSAHKTVKTASLKFDYEIFKRLNSKQKYQYIKALQDAIVEIDAAKNGHHKSAMLELQRLLFPYADAAQNRCWNGGIAYMTDANCNDATLPPNFNTYASDFYHCAADEERCQSALGLMIVDGKLTGACYKRSSYGQATTKCTRSLGADGPKNLTDALTKCQTATTAYGADCDKLKSMLVADTSGIDDFCANASYAIGTCKAVQKKVAPFRKMADDNSMIDPNAPNATPLPNGGSCAAVQAKVADAALQKSMGSGVDVKWARLIMTTEKACGMGGDYDFMKQLRKFGACPATGDQSAPYSTVESALSALQSGQKMNNQEMAAFRDYFGIDVKEYKSVFCKSDSTLAVKTNIDKLAAVGGDLDHNMLDYLLNMPSRDLAPWVAKMNTASPAGSDLLNYAASKATYDQAVSDMSTSCNSADVTAKATCSTATKNKNSSWTKMAQYKNWAQVDLFNPKSSTSFKNLFKNSSDYDALKSKYDGDSYDQAQKNGGISTQGQAARQAFKDCAAKAIDTAADGKSAKTRYTNSCWSNKVYPRNGMKASDVFSSQFGTYTFQDSSGACYLSTGKLSSGDANCASGYISVTAAGDLNNTNGRGAVQQCLDDSKLNFVVYETNCANSAPSTYTCPNGDKVQVPAGGDVNCQGHQVGDAPTIAI